MVTKWLEEVCPFSSGVGERVLFYKTSEAIIIFGV